MRRLIAMAVLLLAACGDGKPSPGRVDDAPAGTNGGVDYTQVLESDEGCCVKCDFSDSLPCGDMCIAGVVSGSTGRRTYCTQDYGCACQLIEYTEEFRERVPSAPDAYWRRGEDESRCRCRQRWDDSNPKKEDANQGVCSGDCRGLTPSDVRNNDSDFTAPCNMAQKEHCIRNGCWPYDEDHPAPDSCVF